MLDDFFEKIDKLIDDKNSMPACDYNNAENQLYVIDRDNKTLSIDDKQYLIPDFFNIENAINGDFKTLDYIFTYFKLDIYNYDKRYKRQDSF